MTRKLLPRGWVASTRVSVGIAEGVKKGKFTGLTTGVKVVEEPTMMRGACAGGIVVAEVIVVEPKDAVPGIPAVPAVPAGWKVLMVAVAVLMAREKVCLLAGLADTEALVV